MTEQSALTANTVHAPAMPKCRHVSRLPGDGSGHWLTITVGIHKRIVTWCGHFVWRVEFAREEPGVRAGPPGRIQQSRDGNLVGRVV